MSMYSLCSHYVAFSFWTEKKALGSDDADAIHCSTKHLTKDESEDGDASNKSTNKNVHHPADTQKVNISLSLLMFC